MSALAVVFQIFTAADTKTYSIIMYLSCVENVFKL